MVDRVKQHRRRERVTIPVPELPAHHHTEPCDCELTIAYVRISKIGEREEDIKSPQIQLDYIAADAVKKNKRIVKLYADYNKSGFTDQKRSVEAIIEDIAKGVAKSVTVWKWSRWGRNTRKSLVYKERVQAAGGRVDSATEDMDPETAQGELTMTMIMGIDQYYSRNMSTGWRDAHKIRRTSGLPHSGRERFGYQYFSTKDIKSGDTHRDSATCQSCKDRLPHFVVDPIEGPMLRDLYMRLNEGKSIRSLVQFLNENEYVSAFGSRWTPQSLIQMMDTGFAAGLLRERSPELIREQEAKKIRVRNSLSSFDVWRGGGHPAVIDERTWTKYKAKRLSRGGLPPKSRVGVHGLSALVVCERCGRRMVTKYSGRDRTHQWVCSWAKSLHPEVSVSISNSNALRVVGNWIELNKKPRSVGEDLPDLVRTAVDQAKVRIRSEKTVKAEIAQERLKIDRYGELYAEGFNTLEQAKAKKVAAEERILNLTVELDQIEHGTQPDVAPDPAIFEKLEKALSLLSSEDLSNTLRKVVGMVVIRPANGRQARSHPEDRVEVVGRWEMLPWDTWFAERRVREFAQP